MSTEKFLMKIREGALELFGGLVLGHSHGSGSLWFSRMLFLKASSPAQLSYHWGEYFHHKALDLWDCLCNSFLCLGMGGEEKCDWQENSAF